MAKIATNPYARTCVLVMGSAWQIDSAIARKDGVVQIVASVPVQLIALTTVSAHLVDFVFA